MMHKWKQELNTFEFRQKEALKQAMHQKRQTSRRMPLFYISFTVVAIACIVLSFITPSATPTVQAATLDWQFSKEALIFAASSQLLLLISYGFFFRTAQVQRRPHRFRQFFTTWQGYLLGTCILLLLTGLAWVCIGLFQSQLVTHSVFGITLMLTYISFTQFLIRKRLRQHCPHCQHAFTKRTILKLNFRLRAIRCPHCSKRIFTNPKENKMSLVITFSFPLFAFFIRLIDLNSSVITLLFIAILLYIPIYFLPYSNEYIAAEENDLPPPLW